MDHGINFKQKIATLNLPKDSYIVVGSGILGALGIRESNDIDLVVIDDVYRMMSELGWEEGRWGDKVVYQQGVFDIGKDWYGQTTSDLLKNAQYVDDIPYLSLNDVYDWKKQRGQEKDIRDIELIDAYRHEQ